MIISSARNESRQLYAGFSWWILEPLIYMTVMYVVFGVILERGGPGFIGFLLIGFIFWRWNDSSVKKASMSLLAAKGILTQAQLPPALFPLADVLSIFLRFLIILVLLTIFSAVYTGQFGAAYMALPLVLGLNLLFVYTLGYCLALIVPLLPDSKKIVDSSFQLLFFASGIFYDISALDPAMAKILYLNPFASFLSLYRGIMLEGSFPSMELLVTPLAATLVLAVLALASRHFLVSRLPKALLR
jgi:lipopolysaccharide transport system permease protein